MIYEDRRAAGRKLAETLMRFALRADVVVLAVPPDGVPVAFEVASRLDVPLDVFVGLSDSDIRREEQYRGDHPRVELRGKTILLIDDGLYTGVKLEAAVEALRRRSPAKIVVAAPVGARDVGRHLATVADEVICAMPSDPFHAVSLWYRNFEPTSDTAVRVLLDLAAAPVYA